MKNKRIFALGFFDGVHRGHQELLRICVELSRMMSAQPAAITFQEHPTARFTENPPALLSSWASGDRQLLLRRYGIGPIYSFPVTPEVMSTPWQDFLQELLDGGAVGFVCGHDFRFGHRGAGNAELLAEYCREHDMPCIIVPEQRLEGLRISSTHIRTCIENGRMEEAVRFLGHGHTLTGQVVPGRHLGRTLGLPTANILFPKGVVCPKHGVYACKARALGREYLAVTNVGSRPTVGGHQVRTESLLLDFDGNLYGETVTVEFFAFLRPEQKFPDLEALKEAVRRDAEQTRVYFANHQT